MEVLGAEQVEFFHTPSRFLIAGLSGSGKSFFTSQLINKYKSKFNKIVVLGSDLENIEGVEIERNDCFDPFSEELEGNTLIVFDDIIFQTKLVKLASEIFIRGRHLKISALFLTQNLFLSDKFFRLISLNSTHVVLFKVRDLKQISYFAKTFLKDTEVDSFISIYKKTVLKEDFNHLLIDFSKPLNSKLRIRSRIFNKIQSVYTI